MDLQATPFRPSGRTVIVGCSATKFPGIDFPVQAGLLYTGSFFQLCHAAAAYLTPLDRILVLSARYGLVSLDQTIEPYDLKLGQPGSITADQVRAQAARRGLLDGEEIVVLAGGAYAEIARGVWPHAHFPLGGCRGIGEQRARLAALVNERRWRGTFQLPASMWARLTPDEQAAYWLQADPPSTSPIGTCPGGGADVEELLDASNEEIRERAATLEPAEYPGVGAFPQPVYLSGVDNPALRDAAAEDWRLGLMVQPGNATAGSIGAYYWYAADNGCYAQGDRFQPAAWLRWVAGLPRDPCLFVVAPDVWGDAQATLLRAGPWLDRVRLLGFPVALVAQDGLEACRDRIPWDRFDCLMVGGTDPWRASPAVPQLVHEALQRGKWAHWGRVNSWERVKWAASIGFDSVDGTYLRYGPDVNLPRLLGWVDALSGGVQLALPA